MQTPKCFSILFYVLLKRGKKGDEHQEASRGNAPGVHLKLCECLERIIKGVPGVGTYTGSTQQRPAEVGVLISRLKVIIDYFLTLTVTYQFFRGRRPAHDEEGQAKSPFEHKETERRSPESSEHQQGPEREQRAVSRGVRLPHSAWHHLLKLLIS